MSNRSFFWTNHRKKSNETAEHDFYSTHPDSVQLFLDQTKILNNVHVVWEPACGRGNISKVLHWNGIEVISTDLIDRAYGKGGVDFLTQRDLPDNRVNVIMTNPPFNMAEQFIEQAHRLSYDGGLIIMFLKLTFLEGKKRFELFKRLPPMYIYLHSSRQGCSPEGATLFKNGGAVAYCWYVWQKGYQGDTIMKWLPPN